MRVKDKELMEKRPYMDTLSPLVNLSNVGKVGQTIAADLPTYLPGTWEPVTDREGFTYLTPRIELQAIFNPCGRGYICAKHSVGNASNLLRGQRKALQRQNLTRYAKRTIISAGDALERLVREKKIKYTVLLTLTYRKNVPDHKTAKKHLANFFRQMKKAGYLQLYAWTAQNQTGERAKQQGKKSYRAKNGEGIHFHIISGRVPIEKARKVWRTIVYNWEQANGLKSEVISGVNIITVQNASRYVARYITVEDKAGTIQGNMWGISAEMRKLCKSEKSNPITLTLEEWRQYVRTYKLKNPKFEVYQRTEKEKIYTVRDFKGIPIVFFRDTELAIKNIYRFKRHLRTLQKIQYAKTITLSRDKLDIETPSGTSQGINTLLPAPFLQS